MSARPTQDEPEDSSSPSGRGKRRKKPVYDSRKAALTAEAYENDRYNDIHGSDKPARPPGGVENLFDFNLDPVTSRLNPANYPTSDKDVALKTLKFIQNHIWFHEQMLLQYIIDLRDADVLIDEDIANAINLGRTSMLSKIDTFKDPYHRTKAMWPETDYTIVDDNVYADDLGPVLLPDFFTKHLRKRKK